MDKLQVIEIDKEFHVFDGTLCTAAECQESGCSFPNCANFEGKAYATLEAVRQVFPDIELVKA